MAPAQRSLPLTVFLLAAACAVPATNPFDPQTPLDQQARGIITGTVALLPLTGGTTVPLQNATITLTQGPSAPQTQTSASDGTFTFTQVMTGTYTLTATHASAYPSSTSVTVAPGATETANLQLLPVPSSGVGGTMNINGGATVTNQRLVVINLLSQGAVTMLISEDPTFTNPALGATTPVPFTTTASYTLQPGDGAQTVYVELIGGSGATLLLSAVITLDTQPPTSPTLAASVNANGWTSSAQLVLSLGAVGASTMQISCNGAAALMSAPMQPFVPTSLCTLGPTPAAYGVAALYFDAAGNEAVPVPSVLTAYYDPTPPTQPVVAGVGEIVNATTFTVSLTTNATDAPITGDPGGPTFIYQLQGGTYTGWQDCGTSLPALGWSQIAGCSGPPFTFPLVANSTNNLRVRARDRAGNVSSDSALTVVADSLAPGVVLHQGGTAWGSADVMAGVGAVTVTWEPPSAVDVAGYLVYYGVGPGNANVPSLFTGNTADQGPSPIDVGKPCVSNPTGNDCTFRLTGLADGSPLIVSVAAYDMTQVPGPNVGALNNNAAQVTPSFMLLQNANTLSPSALGAANGNTRAVAVRDGLAVTTTSGSSNALTIVDVGIPSQPAFLGKVSGITAGYDVALQGTHAYVADGATGLVTVDISTPTAPFVGGAVTGLGNVVSAVAVQNDHVFVTSTTVNTGNGQGSLTVLTINPNENPITCSTASAAQPCVLGSYHGTPATSYVDVAAQGNTVFLAANGHAVYVVDATVPTAMTLLGTCTTAGNVEGISVSGRYVYASASTNITLCDVSNPASPNVVATVATATSGRRVTAAGGYVYTTTTQGLYVSPFALDANGVPSLGATTSFAANGYNSDGGTFMPTSGSIAASGTVLLVAAGSNGLQVLTTASPDRLQTQGTVNPGAGGSGATMGVGNLVVASVGTGWEALHWSAIDPNAYASTGVLGGAPYQLDAAAGLVVGTDKGNGAVYGATILNNKTWTAAQTYTPSGTAHAFGLAASWPYAFVAAYVGGSPTQEFANTLEVIDLRAFATVGNVTFAPGTTTSPLAGRVATYGNYVFVTNGSGTNNLVVINTATPTAPAQVGSVVDGSYAYGDIAASGQHLYVTHNTGFRVLSFKPPYSVLSPTDVGGYDALGTFQPDSIAVSGSTVFLTGSGGVAIFNVTFSGDVPTAQLVAMHTTGITGQGLTVGGTSAAVNNAAGPVQFLNLQ